MRLLVTTEARYLRSRDGTVYTSGLYDRSFFDRYLSVFDEVRVLARVAESPLSEAPSTESVVEDDRVRVHPLPDYRGALGSVRRAREVSKLAHLALQGVDAVMLRAPGFVSQVTHRAVGDGLPYGVELVGDPAEVFRRGASRHPARPLIRRWTASALVRQTSRANVVGYVSSMILPERYPAPRAEATRIYSSVSLGQESFLERPDGPRPVRSLVTVASLEQPYKGVDVLLDALTRLPEEVTLTVVGDGALRTELSDRSARLGLAPRVTFLGNLPGPAAVREVLASSDAFVLASRTEGLPRAMLEAMAAGLPCVGTRVGGIPELLGEEALCEPGDPEGLADRLAALVHDPREAARRGAVLQGHARSYAADVLQLRRDELLTVLRERAGARR